MKLKAFLSLFLLFTTILSFSQVKPSGNSKVEVYYFHGARRCATCVSIEENAKATIDTYFKDQKAKGMVKMIVIDIEDPKNAALVEKYEVSGSSLFVTRLTGGKTFTNDMTNFAFSNSRANKEKFMKGLRDKITESLNK